MPYGYDMPMHEGRVLPSFTLREIDLPQVRNWEVNGKYFLVMEVEMIGKNSNKDMQAPNSDRAKIEGYFRVLSMKVPSDKEQNSLQKKAFEGALARARGLK